jgi:hypothetical protein
VSTTAQEFARRAAWFPAEALAGASSTVTAGDSGLVTNAYLWSSLPLDDQEALRAMNVRLTEMAIEQCASGGGAANQVEFGSISCLALAEFAAHDVFPDELLELSAERDVVFPWSLLYGNARTPFNFRLARLPLAIAYPRTVDDVVFWVGWVRDRKLSVSIRSGNNSYEGLSSSNRIIIDLTFLTLGEDELGDDAPFRIDADAGLVHTAPGVRLGVLYTALAEQGFMLAGGQCPPVCVGGLVGTGGIGFSTRAAGWACDQLVEVECVLANGDVVVANADNEHADLYRACKGAGAAGLCVMTRLTLRLLPAQEILFWSISWNMLDDDGLKGGAKVLEAWQHLAEPAPDAFSSVIFAIASKKADDPDCRGAGLPVSTSLLAVSGELQIGDDWERLGQELEGLVDAVATPEDVLWAILDQHFFRYLPDDLRPGRDEVDMARMSSIEAATTAAMLVPMPFMNQWKLKCRSTFRIIPAEAFEPMFDYLGRTAPSCDVTKSVGYFNAWLLGGASNRIDPASAVVPVREGAVMWVHSGAQWSDPSVDAASLAWVDGLWEQLLPALESEAAFYGIPELELGSQTSADKPTTDYVRNYWSSPTHDFTDFLVGVKRTYDPSDVFRFSQSIPLSLHPNSELGS